MVTIMIIMVMAISGGGESDFGHLHSPLTGCVPAACLKNLGNDDDDDDDDDNDDDDDAHDDDDDDDICSPPPPSCCL